MGNDILDGIRVEPGEGASRSATGAVTYSVLPIADTSNGEKRSGRRTRTRLRSGKILTPANKFVIECLIHDVSVRGAKLHVPAAIKLPNEIRLYRDDDATVTTARVVWRKPSWVGIEFSPTAAKISAAALVALGGKYYRLASDDARGRRQGSRRD